MQTMIMAVLFSAAGMAGAPVGEKLPDREKFGMAGGDGKGACLITHRAIGKFPQPVTVLVPGPGFIETATLHGQIVAKLSKPCEALNAAIVDAQEPAPTIYEIRLDPASRQDYWKGIADFAGVGMKSARACNSMEGFHFTTWKGKPLRSERLWHAYVNVQVDFESSQCEDKDYAE